MLGAVLSSEGRKVNKMNRVSTVMGLSLLQDTEIYLHDPNKVPYGGGTGCHGGAPNPDFEGGSKSQKNLLVKVMDRVKLSTSQRARRKVPGFQTRGTANAQR